MRKTAALLIALCSLSFPLAAGAQEATLQGDTITMQKARVTAISNETSEIIPETATPAQKQTLTALILDGAERGTSVTFENDYIQLDEGDVFYLRHTTNDIDATDYYTVADPYRFHVLVILVVLFLLLLFAFGGLPGVRGLAALVGSFVLIFSVLIPGILAGYSPIFVSVGVSSLIIILGSYITHGFNTTTSAAVIGMIITVMLTGIGAYWAVDAAQLSGYTSDESVSLHFATHGSLDLVGLLFGGIMIGLLGVLYDIAIGQAISVEELYRAGRDMTVRQVFKRALRIGREHIGALVNTLAIAYVGASLPLFLLIQSSTFNSLFLLNSELLATEIIRILIGSIGLIVAVPITTAIATAILARRFSITKS